MSAIRDILERHKSVRGYPTRYHPTDGHTYTAIVEKYCDICRQDQPCDVNKLNSIWRKYYDFLVVDKDAREVW